ncbi:MAG TPA: hypothetical protein VGG25_10280 [Streptosporangiaceae bacterium]|jgi:hypothetical protein
MTTPPGAATGAQAKQGAGQQAQAPQQRKYPFPVGVYETESQDGGTMSLLQTTGAQQFSIYNVSPTGWIRGIWADFTMAVTGQATNSVSYHNDNPWSAINKVTLRDLGQQAVIGPIGGYDWMTLDKFGAYQNVGDPRADLTYTASTGTGSTAGSFTYSLYLPFEFVGRDALGVSENQSKPGWTVELWLDSQANTYNQVPSVMGTMTVNWYPDSYTKPIAQAPSGRGFSQTPPLPGTLQYWRSENESQPASASEYDLVNGIGFPLRNLIYKCIDTSAGTRAAGDTDFPSPFTLQYGNVILFAKSKTRWNSEIGRDFGFTSLTADSAYGRENGVYPVWWTKDMTLEPGAELRYRYLSTATNTLVRGSGTFAAASTLYVLTNWIAPTSKNYYSLIAG